MRHLKHLLTLAVIQLAIFIHMAKYKAHELLVYRNGKVTKWPGNHYHYTRMIYHGALQHNLIREKREEQRQYIAGGR